MAEEMEYTVMLGDNEIESIANGGEVFVRANENVCIIIKQSALKDIAQPIINNDKRIFSKSDIENLKINEEMIRNTFQSGF